MFAIKVIFKYIYILKIYFTILKKEGNFSTVAASMHHPVRKTLQVCLTEWLFQKGTDEMTINSC